MTDPGPTDDALASALLDRLPHTGPARLPQRVIRFEPGDRVEAARDLEPGDPVLNQAGVLPAALLIELMAQAGGLLLDDHPSGRGEAPGGLLAGVRRMHLHDTARAGETVVVTCTVVRRLGDLLMVQCRAARKDGGLLAHGRLQIRRLTERAP